ncbi:MAG TPA: hypothetical protein VNS02_00175 [Rhizobiaceae bacterium]|nr:hypothetical protein [Rhizobiaceae bacterium]
MEASPGVFTPEQVRQMQEEMDQLAITGETESERTERALKIIARHRRPVPEPLGG